MKPKATEGVVRFSKRGNKQRHLQLSTFVESSVDHFPKNGRCDLSLKEQFKMRCTTPPPILKQTHKTYGVDPFQISFRLSSLSSDPFSDVAVDSDFWGPIWKVLDRTARKAWSNRNRTCSTRSSVDSVCGYAWREKYCEPYTLCICIRRNTNAVRNIP